MALPKLSDVPVYEFTSKATGRVIKYIGTTYGHEKVFAVALESAIEEGPESAVKIINEVLRRVLSDCVVSHKMEQLSSAEIEELWLNIRASSSTNELKVSFKAASSCKEQGHPLHNISSVNILDYEIESLSGETIKEVAERHGMIEKDGIWIMKVTDSIGICLQIPNDLKSNDADTIKLVIKNIFDAENVYDDFTDEELTEFLEKLPRNTVDPIREFIDALPTICIEVGIQCPECGHSRKTKLKGIYDFFA